MSKKVKEVLVIDRKKWGRGGTGGSLLNPSCGLMCCLGFYCIAKGLSKSAISGRGMPDDLVEQKVKGYTKLDWLLDGGDNSADAKLLARVNDDYEVTDKEKEKKITKIFATHNVKVEFIN